MHHAALLLVGGNCSPAGAGMVAPLPTEGQLGQWWQTWLLQCLTRVNQSYFMGLFFFWSGYFVPSSLDKKGFERFLHERFIRIGIPFTLYVYLLGPVFTGVKRALLTDGSFFIDVQNTSTIYNPGTSILYNDVCHRLFIHPSIHTFLHAYVHIYRCNVVSGSTNYLQRGICDVLWSRMVSTCSIS